MNRDEIKKILPHREPMLLLDELDAADERAIGCYTFKGDEWFFGGHYPGNPVVPGVMLCEIMAQTCAVLLSGELAGKTPYYTGIDKVRFKRVVRPGETVRVTAELTGNKAIFYFASCRAYVGEEPCCSGELSFALVEGR